MRLHAKALPLLFSALLLLLMAPSAHAVDRGVLKSFGADPNGEKGGQLTFAVGVAINRSGNGAPAGSVYVAEANPNHRISQFDEDGDFIRTWGYDVIDGVNFPAAPNDSGTGFEICDVTNGNTAEECKKGATGLGGAAGQLANPKGIAIDQASGYLYVASTTNRRVDAFTGEGAFVGAFGWDVANTGDAGDTAPVNGFEICTTVCKAAAAAGADPGRFSNFNPSYPAVDPSVPGRLYVPDLGNLRVNQFSVTAVADELTAVSFDRAFGWDVVPANATTTLESCTTLTGCQAGTSGNGAGQFTTSSPTAVEIDTTGAIYATGGILTNAGACSAATPCRVQKFSPDISSATDFGPSEGEGQLVFTAGAAKAVAAIDLAIDPGDDHLYVLRKETETTYRVYEYGSDGTYLNRHPGAEALIAPTALPTNTGLDVGTDERLYVNYGGAGAGEVHILAPVPAPPPPAIAPATELTATGAKLSGEVTVASQGPTGFDTSWRFEYSSNGSKWTLVPVPDVLLGSTPGTYPVERTAAGLEPNTDYVARLAASSTGGTTRSEVIEFTTATEKPALDSVFSENRSQTEMILGAEIDANGLPTTYHFEWGTEAGVYPIRVPAFERHVGSGSSAVIAQESVGGLQPGSTYHFRVIAENGAGETVSEDQQLLTLNSSNLPADRGFELVSPADKGAVGRVDGVLGQQQVSQAAASGGRVAYTIAYGLDSSTSGGEVSYAATRSVAGWANAQVTAPALQSSPVRDPLLGAASYVRYYSPDLDCAILQSHNPLTPDTPPVDTANGVHNLYRWNASDGSYTLLTTRSPLDPMSANGVALINNLRVIGASSDCSTIFIRPRAYTYLEGASGIYEWKDGVLRDAGRRPDGTPINPDDDMAPGLAVGAPTPRTGLAFEYNTVSPEGRLFFMGVSNEGVDSGERAVFVRKGPNPGEVVNASQPTSGNPTTGARYETASRDGSHVFFLANYGLTSAPSNGPSDEDCSRVSAQPRDLACDLYDYDVETGTLTNISANADPDNPRGAVVQGVVDVSRDGSVVYFAALGQLIPGRGRTYIENVTGGPFSASSANVYRYHGGQISFVGTVAERDMHSSASLSSNSSSTLIHHPEVWGARTTPDGDHLLFPSSDNFDGGNPNNAGMAYVYSADSGATTCISCPRVGDPDSQPPGVRGVVLSSSGGIGGPYYPRSLSADGRAFFYSLEPLVPGAIEGKFEGSVETTENIYEWHRGQLSLLAAGRVRLVDASADGADVYIRSTEQLVPGDFDFTPDLYDVRIGSPGFAAPPPAVPCDPGADQCQGAATPAPAAPSPNSAGFSGPGNPPPPAARKAKKNKKKAKRNRKKSRRAKQRKQRAKAKARARKRAAKTNRGGAK